MEDFLTSPFGQLSYWIMVGLIVAIAGRWAYLRVTARHHVAMDVARFLSSRGLQRIPRALENYALCDYVGAAREMKELHEILVDPMKRNLEFAGLFKRMLEDMLADPATRQQTLDQIAKSTTPVVVATVIPPKAA